ncbi:MFS transporter [Microbispora amethystogenes]|uniref:MFS transporter n=1 Tax=Microbispora amethystogenes TaxID=1427754 RepID=A0ABQ4FNX5_9ACTN|nr:MFS transporter [Microbispora amethystogenes]GIH36522.1 MFS transporter [Microbispora amethystogenes]
MTTNQLAGRKEWLALVALAVPPLLVAIDITVLYFAVPSIAADLKPTSTQQLWIIDIYGFVLAGMLLTMGNLGDLFGRRRTLMIGCAIFGLASLGSAFATSPEMLIVCRAVQGLGGAALMPSSLALLPVIFTDDKQRRTAITVFSLAISAGAGFGPVLSGVLLNNFWWGSIFLINAPIIAILLIAMPFLVPAFRLPRDQVGQFDWLSALLSLVAVLSVIWGVKELAINGVEAVPLGAVVGGLVLAVIFVVRQRHLTHPMIDPKLFRTRGFLPVLTVSATGFFLVIGFSVFTTQFLMEVIGLRPLPAALWSMASPVISGSLVPVAMGMVDKVKPAYLMASGFLLAAIGFGIMTQVTADSGIFLVVSGIVGIGVGTALLFALLTDMAVAISPPRQVGAVSALTKTLQEFGGALGLAIFGTIGAAIYRNYLGTRIDGVPAEAVRAARQTMGGAVAVTQSLAPDAARALLAVAREAFAKATSLTAILGIVIALVSAVLLVTRLSHVTYTKEGEEVLPGPVTPEVPTAI